MFSYIIKRLILFVPTLFLVSCFSFYLSKKAPDNQVKITLDQQGLEYGSSRYDEEYEKLYQQLGLDQPEFYFSVSNSYSSWTNDCDLSAQACSFIKKLSGQKYQKSDILKLQELMSSYSATQRNILNTSSSLSNLLSKFNLHHLKDVDVLSKSNLQEHIMSMEDNKVTWFYPVLRWNGTNNQYHRWIGNMIRGDFGTSYLDARPVVPKIWSALRWTLVFSFLVLFLALLISFPLALYNATHVGSRFDTWSTSFLFGIHSVPKFWIATLLIIFFTTSEYGAWTNIFPNVGTWYLDGDQSFIRMIFSSADKLILPVLVVLFPDVAYLSRLIRSNLIEEKNKDYIKIARSKGASEWKIAKDHLIPNALIPTVTLLAGVIPNVLSAGLVMEVIFNIPGMGRLMLESIRSADWAVVFPIILLIGVVTIIVFLVADLIMAYLDPKIKIGS